MRKEPFFVGDFVHVFNRGNRKQEIVHDDKDMRNFFRMLFYFNDEHSINSSLRDIERIVGINSLKRPSDWPPIQPLVKLHAVILKNNHFHMILEEIIENGISRFMHRVGTSMTKYSNKKYDEVGRLFQGSYKAKKIDKDNYLQYLNVYVHVKNAFEMYKGGIKEAMKNYDDAYEFAKKYPYSSLGVYEGVDSPLINIISVDWLSEIFKNGEFKEFAKNSIEFVNFDNKTFNVTFTKPAEA